MSPSIDSVIVEIHLVEVIFFPIVEQLPRLDRYFLWSLNCFHGDNRALNRFTKSYFVSGINIVAIPLVVLRILNFNIYF